MWDKLSTSLPLTREVARRSRDGGRECEGIQQRQYSISQNAEKKYDTMGTSIVVRVFALLSGSFSTTKGHRELYCRLLLCKSELIVELDGGGHYDPKQRQRDNERTQALQSMNLKVLRICNLDVDRHFTDVCEMIDDNVRASLPQSAVPTAPSSEGARDKTKPVQ